MAMATKDRTPTLHAGVVAPRIEPDPTVHRRTLLVVTSAIVVAGAVAAGTAAVVAQQATSTAVDRPATIAIAAFTDPIDSAHGGPGSLRLTAPGAAAAPVGSDIPELAHGGPGSVRLVASVAGAGPAAGIPVPVIVDAKLAHLPV
ncbi:MAG TPA: hypothetical protein VFL59_07635 [Candidatus Nanopelagicales bacterium]|nr:hypothetical protein [Candidatus Nanopelagicales bacterium]